MASPLDTSDLVALLRARGQRVTSQRLVILRELRRRGRHTSAHEISESVRDELPGTSTPTVYATLELLADLGLVRKLDAGIGVALYDARLEPHQHTVCRHCGAVEDLDGSFAPAGALDAARARRFVAERAEVVVVGLCAACAGQAEPDRPRGASSGQ